MRHPVSRTYGSAFALAVAGAFLLSACGGSPSSPSPGTPRITAIAPNMGSTTGGTNVTLTGSEFGSDTTLTVGGVAATNVTVVGPTSVTATLAIITAIRGNGSRPNQPAGFVNVNDTITLIPTIDNGEPSSLLQFAWTGPGAFSPSQSDGTTPWKAPASLATAPSEAALTMAVSETFVEGGVSHTLLAAPYVYAATVHDSEKEVMDMGEDFLTLFTRQLPPDQVLHNFSTTCDGGKGRSDEANDVVKNQNEVIEDFGAFRISRRPGFSINFRSFCAPPGKPIQANADACGSFAVHWEGTDRKSNQRFVVNGIDYVSAVFESNRWRLCHSSFEGTESFPALGLTRAVSW